VFPDPRHCAPKNRALAKYAFFSLIGPRFSHADVGMLVGSAASMRVFLKRNFDWNYDKLAVSHAALRSDVRGKTPNIFHLPSKQRDFEAIFVIKLHARRCKG
jgi:hypothetical protein